MASWGGGCYSAHSRDDEYALHANTALPKAAPGTNASSVTDNIAQLTAPKIIWAYWGQLRDICWITAPCPSPCLRKKAVLPSLVQLSIWSWEKLNPTYDIRILDEETVWNYLDRNEMPDAYDCLDTTHTSDVIRTALLVKYGGVWIDASMIMLKPLEDILGDTSHPATFIMSPNVDVGVPWVENFFLADSPNGNLLPAVKECMWRFYKEQGYVAATFQHFVHAPWCPDGYVQRSLGAPGEYFSEKLILQAEGSSLGKLASAYLEQHMCIAQVLEDREDIRQWWDSSAVAKEDYTRAYALQSIKGWDASVFASALLDVVDVDLADKLSELSWMLKFSAKGSTSAFNKDVDHLKCDPSTLNVVLRKHGLIADGECP